MKETRQTNDTVFVLRTSRRSDGWMWELAGVPIGVDGVEPKIERMSKTPFWDEHEAFADGLRHLDGLVEGPARHAPSPNVEG